MSENLPTPEGTDEAGDRRNFLSRSGLMLALLAIAGEGAAEAADVPFNRASLNMTIPAVQSQEAKPLSELLNSSIRLGKLDTTSPAFSKLSPALRASLNTLTPSDLATLARAQAILGSKLKANLDDNNGTIGM